MYPIRLITIGRPRLDGCHELERHYRTLLRTYSRLDVIELAEGKGDGDRQLREEAQRIRGALEGIRCPVLLDAAGPARTSERFASQMGTWMDRGESLAFVIGSSQGIDGGLKQEIREKLSLSPMTFPHDLSRVMFLEQLYRAFTILKGKTYHK